MRLKIFLMVSLFFLPLFAQSEIEKTTIKLQNQLNGADNNQEFLVWIFFTDKGENLDYYFQNPETVVSKKSLKRRSKTLAKTTGITFRDIPVKNEYVSKIVSKGFEKRHTTKWFNGASGFATKQEIIDIAALSFVKKIDLVGRFKTKDENLLNDKEKLLNKSNGSLNSTSGIYNYGESFTQNNQINVPALHDMGITGEGVTICVMDAGFNELEHEVFDNMNIIAAWDFVNGDGNVDDEGDLGYGGHGTKTLSTIGGFKEGELIGPAFGSDYLLAKTENTESETPVEEDNWVAAMEWADSIGVDVTSTSLGYLDYDPPYESYTWEDMDGNTAIITIAGDIAASLGITVVTSAGNNGYNSSHNTLGAPADGDSIIAVGAVDSGGDRVGFSSVGNTVDGRIKPDVMAMGNWVYVATDFGTNEYTYSSGTSFSCPLTAGVAALLLSHNPYLTPMEVRESLWMTADNSTSPNREYGYGIVDALAASQYFPLPVELTSFTVDIVKDKAVLNWITATEINNRGFEIQRKLKDSDFATIAFVDGYGTTTEEQDYSFTDNSNLSGKVSYRLKQVDYDGNFDYSEIVEVTFYNPESFVLNQNYPNPFNPATTFKYSLPEASKINIALYNVLGKKVKTLVNEFMEAGEYNYRLNASDLASGVYFVRMIAHEYSQSIKIVLSK